MSARHPECVCLSERFGDRYRITYDAVDALRHADPWLQQMPCRYGTIYPHGGSVLALECDRHPIIVRQLRAIPGVTVRQKGDEECTLLFDVSRFDAIAQVVRPRVRRRLAAEQRQLCAKRLSAFSFPTRTSEQKIAS